MDITDRPDRNHEMVAIPFDRNGGGTIYRCSSCPGLYTDSLTEVAAHVVRNQFRVRREPKRAS